MLMVILKHSEKHPCDIDLICRAVVRQWLTAHPDLTGILY